MGFIGYQPIASGIIRGVGVSILSPSSSSTPLNCGGACNVSKVVSLSLSGVISSKDISIGSGAVTDAVGVIRLTGPAKVSFFVVFLETFSNFASGSFSPVNLNILSEKAIFES